MRMLALNLSLTASLAVFGLLALLLPSHAAAQGGCFTNSTGFLLSNFSVVGPGVENMCPPGWYCPNIYRNDSKTWPAVCPASAACVQQRLNYRTCAAQGLYEPVPCTKGHYCPTNREMYECPSGSYCPAGSVKPIKCNGLSSCPAGSHTDYFVGVVLVVGLVDIALVVAYLALRHYLSKPTPLSSTSVTESPEQTTARLIREALGPAQPVQISFENLAVRLSADHETAPNKSLLQGVSGSLRAGEVTAIMGPSGAGKTVLFSTVLGKTPTDWTVEGTLRVCGNLTLQDFPHLVGFVPQDDVLRGDLTVAENILYSSEVRLPADWTAEQRREMRSAVMRALGIDHVRDVQIGDEETRGVSGGQRKRCSVAVELAAAPAVIFLDEPTTGLDATSSLELVRLLKVVAREARIPVAMVIHQPRVEIWNELDSVLLLAPGGRTVYSGHREGVQAHLSRLIDASLFENKGNPADIMMDLIAEHGQLLADDWQVEHSTLPGSLEAPLLQERTSSNSSRPAAVRPTAAQAAPLRKYAPEQHPKSASGAAARRGGLTFDDDDGVDMAQLGPTTALPYAMPPFRPLVQPPQQPPAPKSDLLALGTLWPAPVTFESEIALKTEPPSRVIASAPKQFVMAHLRSFVGQHRKATIFLFDVLLGGVGGALLTYSALNEPFAGPLKGSYVPLSPRTPLQTLAMLIMLWGIALSSALGPAGARTLGATRRTYWREAASGYSRWAYYLGASTAELYRVMLTALHFCMIVYLMWRPNMMFGTLFWVLLMYSIAIDAQSVLIGALLASSSASLAASVVGVFTALFNGFPGIPGSPFSYAFALSEAAYHYEVADVRDVFSVDALDRNFSYNVDRLGYDWALLLGWIAVIKLVGYIVLIFTNRDKQR